MKNGKYKISDHPQSFMSILVDFNILAIPDREESKLPRTSYTEWKNLIASKRYFILKSWKFIARVNFKLSCDFQKKINFKIYLFLPILGLLLKL